ncbi:hypothetical protein VCR15J2_390003 [Vibrio coralliirubri]|uniref:tape measure protein n=1 Tax=Vibrio coralliirubri TaxID=1516159 RepID=UPI00063493F3|nr:tape measure protein [Vibrio coralliirubri]CDT52521.1 hypothetical protein VCR15J2_390003 [Vibrio coralliirubri]
MSLGDITVNLNLDGKDFNLTIKEADQLVNKFGESVDNTSGSVRKQRTVLKRWAGSVAEAVTGLNSFRELLDSTRYTLSLMYTPFIEANAQLEQMTVIMRGLAVEARSTEESIQIAGDSVDYLMNMVQEAPFSMSALQDSFVKFRSAGIDPTNGSLQSLVDSVAKFGGSDEALTRASVAIQQMAGKGVISMEELRQQLGEAVPEAMRLMAAGLGVSMSELTKLVESGTLEAQGALAAMFDQMEMRNSGSAKAMMNTWNGLIAQMRTQRDIIMQEMGKGDLFEELKNQVSDLIELMKSNEGKEFARSLGDGLADVVRVARMVVENFEYVMAAIKAVAVYMAANWARSVVKNLSATAATVREAAQGFASIKQHVASVIAPTVEYNRAMKQQDRLMKASMVQWGFYNREMILAGHRTKQLQLTTAMLKGTMAALTGVVRVAGRALMTMAGPLGAVLMIAYEVANAFDVFGNKLDEIREKAAEGNSFISPDEFTKLNKGLKSSQDELEKTKDRLDAITDEEGNVATLDKVRAERFRKEIAELQRVVVEGEAGVSNALSGFTKSAGDQLEAVVTTEFHSTRQIIANEYQRSVKELEKWKQDALAAGQLTPEDVEQQSEERRKAIDIAMQKQIADDKKALIREKAAKQVELIKLNKELSDEVKEAQIKGAQLRRDTMINEIDKDFTAFTKRVNAKSGEIETFGGKGVYDIFTQKYKTAMVEMAGMQAELSGGNITLAKTLQQVSNQGVKNASIGQDQYEATMRQYEALKKRVDAERELEKISKNLAKQQARLVVDQKKKGEQNPYFKMTSGARQLSKMIEQNKLKLAEWNTETGVSRDQISRLNGEIEELEKLLNKQVAIDQGKTIQGFEKLTRRIQEQTMSESELRSVRTDAFNEQIGYLTALEQNLAKIALQTGMTEAELKDLIAAYKEALGTELEIANETALESLMRDWSDTTAQIENVFSSAFNGMANEITNLVTTGKADFESLTQSIIRMIMQIIVQWGILKAMGFMGMPMGSFAEGGIMEAGKGVKKLAKGGVVRANNPQMAVFGEGDMNEAFVPLPDGRSIPVTMNQGNSAPNVEINMINESGQSVEAEQQGSSFDGSKYILDVVLKAANRPGKFRQNLKGALS